MSTDQKTTIYVKLINEPVEVWRPVDAIRINENSYQLTLEQDVPEDEEWEFSPGETIEVFIREFDGIPRIVAGHKLS